VEHKGGCAPHRDPAKDARGLDCVERRFVGAVSLIPTARGDHARRARRRIQHKLLWPEPFGLVMIEAMACGTPVLAFRCGSIPQVIEDGVTGKVVDSEEEAIAAMPVRPPRGTATV
jgi:hypothetical protein